MYLSSVVIDFPCRVIRHPLRVVAVFLKVLRLFFLGYAWNYKQARKQNLKRYIRYYPLKN